MELPGVSAEVILSVNDGSEEELEVSSEDVRELAREERRSAS